MSRTAMKFYNEEALALQEDLKKKINHHDFEISRKQKVIELILEEISSVRQKYEDNINKIKAGKKLPYLCSEILEIIDNGSEKLCVIKTYSGQKFVLPSCGLIESENLAPGQSVSIKKDSFVILELLPSFSKFGIHPKNINSLKYETFSDIGGLEKEVEELKYAAVYPHSRAFDFAKIGIDTPKGILLYGPPGNGKTLLMRACATEIKSTFFSISATKLLQLHIGEGAKIMRDIFEMAKELSPSILFIDEIDAICKNRPHSSSAAGDREVQRTLIELLSQLDAIRGGEKVTVITATNRHDVLDPALLRSGRLDKKIEIGYPNSKDRVKIMKLHSRQMACSRINFNELTNLMEGFSGAECKAVCVEAGMLALQRSLTQINQAEFIDAISVVKGKKKSKLFCYS